MNAEAGFEALLSWIFACLPPSESFSSSSESPALLSSPSMSSRPPRPKALPELGSDTFGAGLAPKRDGAGEDVLPNAEGVLLPPAPNALEPNDEPPFGANAPNPLFVSSFELSFA